MGGSAAHGISTAAPYPLRHIYPDETIDAYLEKKLRQKYPGKKIEIINAAVTGYQVFQHTAYLLSQLLDYKPDLIIFCDGANDHYTNNPDFNYYELNRYQFWKPRLREPSIGGMLDYFMHWLSKFSGFARGYMAWRVNHDAVVNNGRNDMHIQFDLDSLRIKSHEEAAQKQFLRSIQANISILKENSVSVMICLQPMLVLRDSALYSDEERSFYMIDKNVSVLYPVVVDDLKKLTTKNNVPFIDLNENFNDPATKDKQLFFDYCHLSPLGGEIIANRIFPVLDSLSSGILQ